MIYQDPLGLWSLKLQDKIVFTSTNKKEVEAMAEELKENKNIWLIDKNIKHTLDMYFVHYAVSKNGNVETRVKQFNTYADAWDWINKQSK